MGFLGLGIALLLIGLLLIALVTQLTARTLKLTALAVVFIAAATALLIFAIAGRYGLAAPAGALALWGMRAYLLARQIRASGQQAPAQQSGQAMARVEALEILGLQEGASADEIEAAYKALIVKNHPDQGGTDWLAARLNEARDILLND
ncbi:MAG: DnaJ domain-containing protein [Alphaproteobacteria bacterium]|nr:DnaJ domain-containing protein [Alphaproteobacteria bacterium]